jgi:hypothetical protein
VNRDQQGPETAKILLVSPDGSREVCAKTISQPVHIKMALTELRNTGLGLERLVVQRGDSFSAVEVSAETYFR